MDAASVLLEDADWPCSKCTFVNAKTTQQCEMCGAAHPTNTDAMWWDDLLQRLPPGAEVAVVSMRGSLCPVTLGHVRCFTEAERIIKSQLSPSGRPFSLCIGIFSLNGDHHITAKLRAKGQDPIQFKERKMLVDKATADYKWLGSSPGNRNGVYDMHQMKATHPQLEFTHYDMNGADDVVKYQKWRCIGT